MFVQLERVRDNHYQRATLGSVARTLNAEGIPAPKRATRDNVTLSRILHSPLYTMADEDVYLYYQAKGLMFSNVETDTAEGKTAGPASYIKDLRPSWGA